MTSSDKYAQDGVDISAGDAFSAFAGEICRASYDNSPMVVVTDLSRGAFRGPRGFKLRNLPKGSILAAAPDGIGTKVVIIDAAGSYQRAPHDVIAMGAMDITRYGGKPLVFANVLDVSTLGEPGSATFAAAQDLMRGLGAVAKQCGYVIISGETAELGACVGSENPHALVKFNWAGFMLGAYHPDKMILGDTLAPGQVVVALRDTFRSNGISSVRKALKMRYGDEWWSNPEAAADVALAATPSVQYDPFLNRMHGWHSAPNMFRPLVRMHGIVHLSGGAFESKLGHDLLAPRGLSASFSTLFEPPPIMRQCAEWRGMSDEDCYRTWNGGQGALVVIDRADVETFLSRARDFDIEAQVSGEILPQRDFRVQIRSQFGSGEWFSYN